MIILTEKDLFLWIFAQNTEFVHTDSFPIGLRYNSGGILKNIHWNSMKK